MKVHCVVHINENCYWSTLNDKPDNREDFMQRCNVHFAYVGRGIYAQLILRTTPMDYAIFGITQSLDDQEVETKPLILGSLTSEESKTLDCLWDIGLSPPSRSKSSSPSASTGSEQDLQCVKKELQSSLYLAGLSAPDPSSFLPELTEPHPSTSPSKETSHAKS